MAVKFSTLTRPLGGATALALVVAAAVGVTTTLAGAQTPPPGTTTTTAPPPVTTTTTTTTPPPTDSTTTTLPPPTTSTTTPSPTTAPTDSTTTSTSTDSTTSTLPPPPPPAPSTTSTTVVTPGQVAELQHALTTDLAKTGAITAFVQAKQLAGGKPAAPPAAPPELVPPVDTALVKAAATELAATRARAAAQAVYDSARRRLGALAVALYVRSDRAVPLDPGDGYATMRSAFLDMLVARAKPAFAAAKRRLEAANQTVTAARAEADSVVNDRAAALEKVVRSSSTTAPASPAAGADPPPPPAPTILGPAVLTADEVTGWFGTTAHPPRLTVPLVALSGMYQSIGATDQVRADIAFAQAVVETGYFGFPSGGQVTPADNNFAGIGACDGCDHGFHFPDAHTGVAAHLQLLHEYASPQPIPGPLPPFSMHGCCPTWMSLTGKWASAIDYGYAILSVYRHMLEWAVSQRASAAGL